METRPPTIVQMLDRGGVRAVVLRAAALPLDRLRRPDPAQARRATASTSRSTRRPSSRSSPTSASPASRSARSRRSSSTTDGSAIATLEIDSEFAPIPEDTQAILRQKTLLGETYVELTPGSPGNPADSGDELGAQGATTDTDTTSTGFVPEGGSLDPAQVSEAVQLDEIFRTFDDGDPRRVPDLDAGGRRRSQGPRRRPQRRARKPRAVRRRGQRAAHDPRLPAARDAPVRAQHGRGLRGAQRAQGPAPGPDPQHRGGLLDDGGAQRGPPGGLHRLPDVPRRVAPDARAPRALRDRHRPADPAAAPRRRGADPDPDRPRPPRPRARGLLQGPAAGGARVEEGLRRAPGRALQPASAGAHAARPVAGPTSTRSSRRSTTTAARSPRSSRTYRRRPTPPTAARRRATCRPATCAPRLR